MTTARLSHHCKRLKVLVIGVEHTSSCQILIVQPLRYLRDRGICSFEVRAPGKVTKPIIKSVDMVIFIRTVDRAAYQCLQWAHRFGKKTVYVIDDHFLAVPKSILTGRYYAKPERRNTLIKFLKNTQMIKVDSNLLFQHIRKQFNANVVYFPGGIDFSILDNLPKKMKRTDGKITIGYEGANKESSFKPVIPALKRIASEYGDRIRFEFFGYVPRAMSALSSVSYFKKEPNYKKFMKRLYKCSWDIGLAPLEDSLFHQCKTNIKFRDYASCGIPGIYSSSPAYSDCVVHKKTGYVTPQTEEGWYSAIKDMIENPGLRERIRDNAGKHVRSEFTLEKCADNWCKHIFKIKT